MSLLLVSEKPIVRWALGNATEEQIVRFLWLRSVEWAAFPAWLSNMKVPVALIFLLWYAVLLTVYGLGILWCAIRYHFISVTLSILGGMIVSMAQYPLALSSGCFLLWKGHYAIGILAILWPFLTGFMGIPGKVGVFQQRFAQILGIMVD
jgi:hypothetical protein